MKYVTNEELLGLLLLAQDRGYDIVSADNEGFHGIEITLRHRYWSHGKITIRSETPDRVRFKAIINALPDLADPEA